MTELSSRFERAMDFYHKGQLRLALDELNFLAHQQLPAEMAWQVCKALAEGQFRMGNVEESARCYERALTAFFPGSLQERQRLVSNYLFLLHYLPTMTSTELAQEHLSRGDIYRAEPIGPHGKGHKNRLRIGYLSPDFGDHVDMLFFIQLLACRSRDRFEAICYSLSPREDDTTRQIRGLADGWRGLAGLSAREAAGQIYGDGIDILFDLSGHAHGGVTLEIMGFRPAPVQLSGIGYMSTTGLSTVDYFLTDGYCDPQGSHDRQFSEKLLRLPHSHLCYTPSTRAQQAQEAYDSYEVHSPIVFGSFNNFAKITDDMLVLWKHILAQVPGSRLLLKDAGQNPYGLRSMKLRLHRLGFQEEQILLVPPTGDYMAAYPQMDIALDTYPYPGGGTTCDALYMGVPVVSRYGDRHGSRFGRSLLENIGLGELAAADGQEYAAKAILLAQDRNLLGVLHKQLRSMLQASPVMDGRQYTHDVEAAYEKIWQQWSQA